MPEKKAKTIKIDEVLPAGGGEPAAHSKKQSSPNTSATSASPIPDISALLGWKALITLKITQAFLWLRAKSWGKWVIVPLVTLTVFLVITLAIILAIPLIILAILKSLFSK